VNWEASLGKDIREICPNRFHDENQNHCAHYVSHIANIGFSFNCVEFKGGIGEPANVRVHEIFAQCPKVGRWTDANETRQQLIFVTRADVVDLPRKKMQNIPQKHIGILSNGYVYHYSNTADKVIKQTPRDFLDRFQNAYSGHQELFFGYFPGEDLDIEVDPTGTSVGAGVAFELRKQNSGRWYAKPKGGSATDEFLVGKEFQNESAGYFGLYIPVGEYYGARFSGDDYQDKIDHWAYLLEVTGHCESQNFFNVINTYDRAKFTFSPSTSPTCKLRTGVFTG
jgi:hypothetical protein